jgi:hypothetical protein
VTLAANSASAAAMYKSIINAALAEVNLSAAVNRRQDDPKRRLYFHIKPLFI